MMAGFEWMDKYNDKSNPINVLSLAEAPGGFLQAIIEYRKYQGQNEGDAYYGITLKKTENNEARDWSEYGMINGQLSKDGKNFFSHIQKNGTNIDLGYGPDEKSDGDLTNVDIIEFLQNKYKDNKANIVTADGDVGAGSGKYGSKNKQYDELMNHKLLYGEILTAISTQAAGGTFILKIKDIYTNVTKQLIQLLTILYDEVSIVKPKNSRPTNSERYILSTGFRVYDDENPQTIESFNTLIEKMKTTLNEWNTIDNEELQKQNGYIYADRDRFLTGIFDIVGEDDINNIFKSNQDIFVSKQLQTIYEESYYLGIPYDDLSEKVTVKLPDWPKEFEEFIKRETLAKKLIKSSKLKIIRN